MKHIWLLVASSSPATGVQCRETPEHNWRQSAYTKLQKQFKSTERRMMTFWVR